MNARNRPLSGDKRGIRGLIAALTAVALALVLPSTALAVFPPGKNGVIAHVSSASIWSVNPDGSNRSNLTPGQTGDTPNFFPNGDRIVFSRDAGTGTGPDLYVMPAGGGAATRITSLPGRESFPTVSPDGHFVAFSYDPPDRSTIALYRMEFGHSPVVMSSTPDEFIFEPDYSPDGSSLIFHRNDQHLGDGNSGGIVRLDLDGGGEQRLSTSASDFSPHYSPDGSKVAFIRFESGGVALWVMNSDGSDKHRVVGPFGGGATMNLGGYSPDGTKLAFSRSVGGQLDLFVAGADGSNPANITPGNGVNDYYAAWQRLPAGSDDGDDGDGSGGILGEVSGTRCALRNITITGTIRRDIIRGTRGRDVIATGPGADVVFARSGRDIVCGDGGRDTLLGGGGRDTLLGGRGKDTLWGGPRRDLLLGGPGLDRLIGGAGRDLYGIGPDIRFP